MKARLWMIAGAAALLAACGNENKEVSDGPVEARITAGIDGRPATRAVDQSWSAGDEIGVMVTSAPNSTMATLYKNVKYTVSGAGSAGTFTAAAGKGVFFQDAAETVTFAAYSPYQETDDAATLPGTEGLVTGVNTQAQATTGAQEKFDYLFAEGATASKGAPAVEFKDTHLFKHQMARLILVLKTSAVDGFTATDVFGGTYKLGGLKHDGTFKVTDGTAAASETAAAVDGWDITNNYRVDDNAGGIRTYTMILYPQTLSGALTFSATVGGQTYTNSTGINPGSLVSGTSYTYTVTMKKTGITVEGSTIAAWNTGTGGDVDATM